MTTASRSSDCEEPPGAPGHAPPRALDSQDPTPRRSHPSIVGIRIHGSNSRGRDREDPRRGRDRGGRRAFPAAHAGGHGVQGPLPVPPGKDPFVPRQPPAPHLLLLRLPQGGGCLPLPDGSPGHVLPRGDRVVRESTRDRLVAVRAGRWGRWRAAGGGVGRQRLGGRLVRRAAGRDGRLGRAGIPQRPRTAPRDGGAVRAGVWPPTTRARSCARPGRPASRTRCCWRRVC